MLQSGRREETPDEIADGISMEGAGVVQEPVSRPKGTIGLFLAEEQQILREAYQSVFNAQSNIELLGSTADTSTDFLAGMVQALKPDVIILGVKAVQPCTVEKLEALREACPQMGLVLLLAMYDGQGIKALREFSRDSSTGCAYLLKHTIDTVEHLTQVVSSVAGESSLTPRRWRCWAGWPRATAKAVERHINNIYSKLQNNKLDNPDATMHPRVCAALMYLNAVGLLSGTEDGDE